MEEQLEKEKQKRVEHLAQVGLRRMFQQGPARGWTAWHDLYEHNLYQKRLSQSAALSKPRLVHAVTHWRTDYESDTKLRASMTQEAKLKEAEGLREAAEKENVKLREELAEARELMLTGNAREIEMERRLQGGARR